MDCRKYFSVTTGTVFHRSMVSLLAYLAVRVSEMCANKNGLAARKISRKCGGVSKTSWLMTQRNRENMTSREGWMSDDIVADETYIGGKLEDWHADDPRRAKFACRILVICNTSPQLPR